MCAVLVAVTIGGAHVGAAIVARHRAQAAADLAALAGAAMIPAGAADACARAMMLTAAMGGVAVGCEVEGLDVVVTVESPVGLGVLQMGPARAIARAGPAETGAG